MKSFPESSVRYMRCGRAEQGAKESTIRRIYEEKLSVIRDKIRRMIGVDEAVAEFSKKLRGSYEAWKGRPRRQGVDHQND